jgi:hypothetical protein
VPIRLISDAVYKASVDWINLRYPEALSFFLLRSLDSILDELRSQLTVITQDLRRKNFEAKLSKFTEAELRSQLTAKEAKKSVQLASKSSVTYDKHLILAVLFLRCRLKLIFMTCRLQCLLV